MGKYGNSLHTVMHVVSIEKEGRQKDWVERVWTETGFYEGFIQVDEKPSSQS
jgi:hypothetical protein